MRGGGLGAPNPPELSTPTFHLRPQVPVFGLPALVMALPVVARMVQARPKAAGPVSFVALMFGFGVGLPAATAMSPQIGVPPAPLPTYTPTPEWKTPLAGGKSDPYDARVYPWYGRGRS